MNPIAAHVTGLQHIGLPTNRLNETLEFYQKLGFELALQTTNGDIPVCFLKLHNICIETYENGEATEKRGAIDHVALDVDDIQAAWEAAKAAGLHILEPDIQFLPFWEKGIRYFNVLGPNQEVVEFSQIL